LKNVQSKSIKKWEFKFSVKVETKISDLCVSADLRHSKWKNLFSVLKEENVGLCWSEIVSLFFEDAWPFKSLKNLVSVKFKDYDYIEA